MNVFAIGDLHLLGGTEKQMDVFGPKWEGHALRISEAWHSCVGENDLVLIPGDISWAMKLEDAADDLSYIGELPGTKVIIRGNHDYWWTSIGRVRAAAGDRTFFLQNDAVAVGGVAVCGTRGWWMPGEDNTDADDVKIYKRELMRLELSLVAAKKLNLPIVAMIHYPPFDEKRHDNGFAELFSQFDVVEVVYGHLHGAACKNAVEGVRGEVNYSLCSADHLDFAPKHILTL